MTFNDDGSLRCNLCNSDPCVCGKPKNPSREAFEEWWKTICDATPREEKLLAAIRPYALGGFKAALAWKAEQDRRKPDPLCEALNSGDGVYRP